VPSPIESPDNRHHPVSGRRKPVISNRPPAVVVAR
jgi:hypothetical protein